MVFRPRILAVSRFCKESPSICGGHVANAFKFLKFRQLSGMSASEKPCPKAVGKINADAAVFKPRKVLVLSKITRYEFEKRKHLDLTEEQLSEKLARKGSDYRRLKELHDYHIDQAKKIVSCLKNAGIETQIANRYEYGAESIKWADAILTAGGDGTYLLGASKLRDSGTPLIGINTDPRRSEGYLCLPKEASLNFKESLDKLLHGQFRWFHRQRIRIELSGPHAADPPVELHEQQLTSPEHRFTDWMPNIVETDYDARPWQTEAPTPEQFEAPQSTSGIVSRILPEAALNEVFIGESLSSRVSYYEISVDGGARAKQKSSGVTVCTGTGSTSWSFNINKLTQQATASIIRIIRNTSQLPVSTQEEYAALVAHRFNEELVFDPSDKRMVFTIRDPVSNTTYSASNPRGFAERVLLKSRCYDASLVIDGGASYKFNDGASVLLTVHPEDALKTVQLL